MLQSFTAKYSKIDAGYMGQLVEWPEVITEGKSIEECQKMLRDALNTDFHRYEKHHNKTLVMPSTQFLFVSHQAKEC